MKNVNDEELFIPKKKHKFIKFLLFLLILGLIIGGGYYYYKNFFSNPTYIIHKGIDIFKEANTTEQEQFDKLKINTLVTSRASFNNELKKIEDLFNNLSIQLNGEFDNTNNKSLLNIDTKYKEKNLIKMQVYDNNKNTFLYLENIFDKYIKVGKDNNVNINTNDLLNIKNGFINAITNELKKHEYQRKEENIILNNETISVNNNYLEFKNNDFNNFLINICNDLMKNGNFIKAFNNLDNIDMQKELNSIISSLTESEFKGIYTLSFYTKKSLKQEFLSIRQNIKVDNNDFTISFDLVDKNNYLLTMNNEKMVIECQLSIYDNKFNIDLQIKVDESEIELISNVNYEKLDYFTEIDTKNNIELEKLSEDDYLVIEENISKNENMAKIYKDIFKIMRSIEISNEV